MNSIGTGRVEWPARWAAVDPWSLAGVPIGLLAALLFAFRPRLIELLALLVLALPLLTSAKARVVFITVGTITVFGPDELTSAKLLFMFGTAVALAGSFLKSRRLVATPIYRDLRPLLLASAGLMLLIGVSLFVAHANGVPQKDWLRDVAPYGLLACAPLFAFDAQTAFGARGLHRLLLFVGLTSVSLFTLRWYGNRGISTDLTGGIGIPSVLAAGALFAFSISNVLEGRAARLRWLLVAGASFGAMVSTGTRLAAVLLAAPLGAVIASRQGFARRSIRLAVALPLAAVLVGIGSYATWNLSRADTTVVSQRIAVFRQSGSSSDRSYDARLRQIHSSWAIFRDQPAFGVGPGHPIPWTDFYGQRFENAFVDTPVGFLPDFGIAGLIVVAFLGACYVSVLRRLRRRTGVRTTSQIALIGFAAVVVAYSILQVPFEDKGLSVGLLLLLAITAREAADRARLDAGEPRL